MARGDKGVRLTTIIHPRAAALLKHMAGTPRKQGETLTMIICEFYGYVTGRYESMRELSQIPNIDDADVELPSKEEW